MTTQTSSILWRASTRETNDSKPIDEDKSVDLVVVGGGFTGLSAALEAATRGASVCVLEGEIIGHGGSGRNVGLVNAGLWLPPDTVVGQMGEAAGRRLIDILADAPRRVFEIIDREAIDCEATRQGTLHLAHSKSGFRDLQERYRQGNKFGAPLELLDADGTARRTGTVAYHGSLFDPRAGTIQPFSYCRGLARAAQERGASVHHKSPVTSITRNADRWIVQAKERTVTAKALVLATNAYQAGIESPFTPQYTPVSYCQFATVPMPEVARHEILTGGEGCWDTALVMSSFRIDKAGRMILGGIGNTEGPGAAVHRSWARRKLRAIFPSIGDLPFEHMWRGRIAMTDDHVPKIVAFGPDAYACFGYSGRGIGPGTVFGAQAAIALLEGTPDALPIAPIERYSERFSRAKTAYYETGATVIHLTA
ncbi:FAD-binding oxidoreductase [Rhizobium sp. KVB221]|uniref:FAD-binding oxidoreductase n=1 Tax=Rhizobium setariae TaxID=2801340 RepID=A0A936YTA1_9HYPH|nr:FAD-binding oxidoreductase [Rhizobium setariae]MBL0373969.1 FAD-binding oxidoreductase [Rhizobium setariae]